MGIDDRSSNLIAIANIYGLFGEGSTDHSGRQDVPMTDCNRGDRYGVPLALVGVFNLTSKRRETCILT
jgi:hypothetical protein